jgi:predicted DNA-binding transcriptional regulator YafY
MLLQRRGKMTAAELADELEVSRRTILRDVEALSISGVPLYAEGGHGGGILLDKDYQTTLTRLNEAEVRALFIAGNHQLLAEVGLGEAAAQMERKLSAALPARHHPVVDHIQQRIYIDPLWWWHDAQPFPHWAELQKAVYEDRRIQVVYENYQQQSAKRTLEPYSLVAKSSYWYLVARRDGEFRTYRVSRLRSLQILDERFVRDADFDLVHYWHTHLDEFVAAFAEYEFVLRIHPNRLSFVQWLTPGRHFLVETDAAGWHVLRIGLESEALAQMLVFGLGSEGEVLSPPELRARVAASCRQVLSQVEDDTLSASSWIGEEGKRNHND